MNFKFNNTVKNRILANSILIAIGIILFVIITNLSSIFGEAKRIVGILNPFIYGIVIAYILHIPMKFIEKKVLTFMDKSKKYRAKRMIAIFISYVFAVLIIVAIFSVIIPELAKSISTLIENIQLYGSSAEKFIEDFVSKYPVDVTILNNIVDDFRNISTYISQAAGTMLTYIFQFSANITQYILNIFIGVIISIYILADKEKFFAQTKKVVYAIFSKSQGDYIVELTRQSNKIFVGFLGGKLLDSLIIGIICFVCMNILRLPYPLLVSFIIGITNIVPVFGPFIGAIPSTLIILIVDPVKALWFVIFVLILQQFDGNILGPKILGDSTGLSAFWVIFAILLANGLFGFVGMIIGVPLFAVIYSVLVSIINMRLKSKGFSSNINEYASEENKIIQG